MAKILEAIVTRDCWGGRGNLIMKGSTVTGALADRLVNTGKARATKVEDPTPGGLTTGSAAGLAKRASREK